MINLCVQYTFLIQFFSKRSFSFGDVPLPKLYEKYNIWDLHPEPGPNWDVSTNQPHRKKTLQ